MELSSGILQEPQRIVVYGPEGIGKSTLASKLPDPVFCDVEGSTSDLDVKRTPKPSSWRALCDIVAEFTRDHHGRRSFIVDTADWAEKLAVAQICATHNLTSLGGQEDFGRSFNLLETEWCRFLDSMTRLAASGMHAVLLAHAGIKSARQPDVDAPYDRWELKMERKTCAVTKEWARTVLFCNYKTYIVEDKGKKRGTGGHRVIYTSHAPAWDAKNRAGLPDELKMDYAEIARLFTAVPPAASQPAPVSLAPTATSPAIDRPEPAPQAAPTAAPKASAAFLTPLLDLMKRDGVSEREVQLAVAKRGYYPADTPLSNYDPTFVAGKLVAYWPQVQGLIAQVRQEATAV